MRAALSAPAPTTLVPSYKRKKKMRLVSVDGSWVVGGEDVGGR